jgi:hypothetical protein
MIEHETFGAGLQRYQLRCGRRKKRIIKMISSRLVALAFTMAFGLQLMASEDFQRNYVLGPGGQIVISAISGNVVVKGYEGKNIEIIASKNGVDRDRIEIRDNSVGNRIELRSYYPGMSNGDASVDFEVRVPSGVRFNFRRLSSFSGNVQVSKITGLIRVESVRGDVDVEEVTGVVSATSVSGNIHVMLSQAKSRNNMKFSSISGNIEVRVPAQLDAIVDMSSASGLLKTDFPIEIQQRRYGPGYSARGKLGNGRQILRITTVSGSIRLIRR